MCKASEYRLSIAGCKGQQNHDRWLVGDGMGWGNTYILRAAGSLHSSNQESTEYSLEASRLGQQPQRSGYFLLLVQHRHAVGWSAGVFYHTLSAHSWMKRPYICERLRIYPMNSVQQRTIPAESLYLGPICYADYATHGKCTATTHCVRYP